MSDMSLRFAKISKNKIRENAHAEIQFWKLKKTTFF